MEKRGDVDEDVGNVRPKNKTKKHKLAVLNSIHPNVKVYAKFTQVGPTSICTLWISVAVRNWLHLGRFDFSFWHLRLLPYQDVWLTHYNTRVLTKKIRV